MPTVTSWEAEVIRLLGAIALGGGVSTGTGSIVGLSTEAKQSEIIQKLDLITANLALGGTLQPPIEATATETVSEAIAANTATLKWNITNLSRTDELYYCLGGVDANLLNSRVLLPWQSVWSDNLIEAQSRITVITRSSVSVNYSVQLITI